MSALVNATLPSWPALSSLAQLDPELSRQRCGELGMQRIDLVVGEGPIGSAVRDRVCQALAAGGNRSANIGVEQRDVLHELRPPLPYELHDSIRRKVLVD